MRGRSWEMNGNAQTGNDVRTLGGRTCSSEIGRLACVVFWLSSLFLFSQQICPRAGLVTISGYKRVPDLGRPDSLKVPPLAGLLGSRVPFVTHLSLSLLGVGRQRRSCFLLSCLQALYGLDGRRRHTRAVCCWRRWRRVPGEAVRRVLMTPQGPPGAAEGCRGR